MKITKKVLKEVDTAVGELMGLLGLEAKCEVSEDKENEAVLIKIESEKEKGLIIGTRGETLRSLQVVIGLILRRKLGDWVRVIVDIGDWREKKEEKLKELADQAIQRLKDTGQEQPIYNLSSSDRRVIHMYISKDPSIETESQGEGVERFLVVKKK